MNKTSIEWTDRTWNPVAGCSRVSEGCRNCYAERIAARFSGPGKPYEGLIRRGTIDRTPRLDGTSDIDLRSTPVARWSGEVRLVADHLADPLRWRKPQRIFVNSMSDLFHEKLTNEQIAAVFGVMGACPQHTFQVLTKRAKRMREWFTWLDDHVEMYAQDWSGRECGVTIDAARDLSALEYLDETATAAVAGHFDACHLGLTTSEEIRWPLPNVWLGVSVENQDAADERIPELLRTPAAVRFLSCEPLLGPLDLTSWLGDDGEVGRGQSDPRETQQEAATPDQGFGPAVGNVAEPQPAPGMRTRSGPPSSSLSWVIAGCESGHGARPCDVSWLRALRDQCAEAGVPYFLKQALWYGAGSGSTFGVDTGDGAKRAGGGVIKLPYLDGVQHAAFPVTPEEKP